MALPDLPTAAPGSVTDPDSQVNGIIRDLSKLVAGALATNGVVNGSSAQVVAGVVAAILSLLWSRYNARKTTKFIAAAAALPAGASRADIAAASK